MFWWGRANALVAIGTIALAGAMAWMGEWAAFFGVWFAALLLRAALAILNVLVTALTGTPLFYGTKILPPRGRGRDDG